MTNIVKLFGGEVYLIEKFEKLEPEKQEDIRKAALEIFADKGFQDASTNKIVEQAGISKGTLFYYFKNKKGLFYYLIDYSLEIITKEYIEKIDYSTTDFIQRLSNNSKIKYRYYQLYPEVNAFLTTVLFSEINTLSTEYQEKFNRLIAETSEKMTENIEVQEELFKDDVNPKEAAKIIEFSIAGYFSQLTEQFNSAETNRNEIDYLWKEFENYLKTLRAVFYK